MTQRALISNRIYAHFPFNDFMTRWRTYDFQELKKAFSYDVIKTTVSELMLQIMSLYKHNFQNFMIN